ncbi:unnamed protein product [Linum trigynum]|uniref:Uncharacterized protein n=1 Tax=Linum trigynum TaxID=586398 RepID=A0AAV2FKU5_9ROSI
MSLRAWVREISGEPTSSAISGETGRGFMMPRGWRVPAAGLGDAVAQVTVWTNRWLGSVGAAARRRIEEGEEAADEARKGTAWAEKKVEEMPEEEIAIGAAMEEGSGRGIRLGKVILIFWGCVKKIRGSPLLRRERGYITEIIRVLTSAQ